MNCPICGCEQHQVLETRRHDDDSGAIRRRRKCCGCQFRWSTVEMVVGLPASVVRLSSTRSVRVLRRMEG